MINYFQLTRRALLLLTIGLVVMACSKDSVYPSQDESLNSEMELQVRANPNLHFKAHLSGKNSVPMNDSKATGQVNVTINKSGNQIRYKLITANIENVLFAHFHMAPAGQNGGVVATLYFNPDPQPSGPANGVLAQGNIMAGDVVGALAGDLDALIDAIRNGNIYINVHTTAIPSGELRGQL